MNVPAPRPARGLPLLLRLLPLLLTTPAAAQLPPYRVAADYVYSHFDRDLEPWHVISTELSVRSPTRGTLLGRATGARRFEQTGVQLEMEAYPRLTPRTYGYLEAGWSPSGIFPRYRLGAELFAMPARAVEVSVGVRRLAFEVRDVTILTGSVGAYSGNYYVVARPFVSSRDDGTSISGTVAVRRYFRDADDYVTVRVGGGRAPGDELTSMELDRLRSLRVRLDGKRPLGGVHLRWAVGWEAEELPGERERRRVVLGIGAERRFGALPPP